MASQNILTIDVSNIYFNTTKFKMVGSLTLDKVKIKYNWIFNAIIKDAIIGEENDKLVWYSGTWINGTWEDGIWYSGTFLDGRWKDGNVYSYDIDINQLLNGKVYIYRVDISKTHFVNCKFEGGNFNYGIFGNIKNESNITLPYKIDRDFIIKNIEDYQIDNGFNSGSKIGVKNTSLLNTNINTITFDSYSKILLGGKFDNYNDIKTNNILRLNYDGTIDNVFKDFNNNSYIKAITSLSDDKIIIGGDFNTYDNNNCGSILKLNYDGTIDNSFIGGFLDISGNTQLVNTISIDSNNSIIVGGEFISYNSNTFYLDSLNEKIKHNISHIIKLKFDGSIDTSFQTNGFNNKVNTIKIDSNNKYLVGGDFTLYSSKVHNKIIRLNSDGSIDTSFLYNIGIGSDISFLNNNSNVGFFGVSVNAIETLLDGTILVGGEFTAITNGISSVDISGVTHIKYVTNSTYNIARLNSDGIYNENIDFSFGNGFKYNNSSESAKVNSIKVQSDGKIIIGGLFNSYNDISVYNIVRLNVDGSIDPTFSSGSGTYNNDNFNDNVINTVNLDLYGKIYLGGDFDIYNQTEILLLTRLNSDGIIDNKNKHVFIEPSINNAVFMGGNFMNGLFNSAIFENGKFYNGFLNNSIWLDGTWYNGEFLDGDWNNGVFLSGVFSNGNWYNGEFSSTTGNATSVLGLNYKNQQSSAVNWYNGTFSNGVIFSIKYVDNDAITEKLTGYSQTTVVDNSLFNWFDGIFNNGQMYSGTFHNGDWNNGIMHFSHIINIMFNNGHIINTICDGGVFNNGTVGGGIFNNITVNDVDFGYELSNI